jgi:hypothetical protein
MTSNESLIKQIKPDSGPEPINKQRRTLISGAAAALFASPRLVKAEDADTPNDPFILLLTGIYQPVPAGKGPKSNLGLTKVNLNDGTYSTTQIYPVFGIEGADDDKKKAIGTFYVQFAGNLCAYDLPGGAIAMSFNSVPAGAPPGFNGLVPFPDGHNGFFLEGTFELAIIEATGVYRAFQGGHNHMVDRLHQLASGQFDEFCFCNISSYQFP